MMRRRMRSASAAVTVLACSFARPTIGEASVGENRPLHARRLQDDAEILYKPPITLDPVDIEMIAAAEEGEFDDEAFIQKQQVDPAEPQDAVIRGMAYNDINYDGQYDVTREEPLQGVVAVFFSCSNGKRRGSTRTDEEGNYSFTIPGSVLPAVGSGEKNCYYIQYSVNDFIMPNAKFTTPRNGETNDIYIGQGEERNGVDAGVYSVPPEPTPAPSTWEWTTYVPTDDKTPVPTSAPTPPPTPTPTPPPTNSITNPGGQILPVPVDFPGSAPMTQPADPSEGEPTPDGEGFEAVAPPATAETDLLLPLPSDIASNPNPPSSASTAASSPMASPAESLEATEVDTEGNPGGSAPDSAPEGSDASDPTLAGEPAKQELSTAQNVTTDEQASKEENSSYEEGILSLEATVKVLLENIATQMDDSAKSTFEAACVDFLGEQLAIATPPVTNVGCSVLNQELVVENARGRHLRRALQQSSLAVDVVVTGEAEKTPSIQEPEDVPFEQLVVGIFNVQGYLFAEALQLEERETQTTTYFKEVGDVRGVQLSTAEDAAPEPEGGSDQSSGTLNNNKGMIAAVAVGGLVVLMLALVIVRKARRRRSNRSVEGSSAKSRSSTASPKSIEAKSKAAKVRASRAKESAKTPKTPSPVKSMGSYTAPCSSGEVEIGLSPISTAVPSLPVSPTPSTGSKRSTGSLSQRVQREIMAPTGKLGIMVANTTGYGPAVHTIRPGSPMEGLVYPNDIIIAVNDVDTREYTADQITRLMKDTVGEVRKIEVLSAHR